MSLINIEELNKRVALATDGAWRRETNTTINSIVEHIVKESLIALTEQLEKIFTDIQADIDNLYSSHAILDDKFDETLKDATLKNESNIINGSKNGGYEKPQRNTKRRSIEGDTRITAS